ncbi:MAG: mechanosensitive ion channel family protein, partial [Bdellovibrionota bacterium]
ALSNPMCLDEPEPVFIFDGFGDSSMNVQIQVYTVSANLLKMKKEIYIEIKRRFDKEGIDIPYPVRTLIMAPPSKAQPEV